MAAESEVKILTVDAVQNMADLRKAIRDTKAALDGMELGSDEYRETLQELIKEQNLMRGALNGTTASMDDLKAAAAGTETTYNGLVNQMANMKRELRNIDVSTKEGAERFKNLAAEINGVNDRLKEMDAQQGSFVRNVGNYTSGLKNLGDILKQNIPALGGVAQGIDGIDKSVQLLGKQPILGIIGLLAPLLTKIASSLKEDEGAMAAVKKVMDSLKPVTDFFAGILDQVVGLLGDVIGRVGEFLGSSGVFQQVIKGVVGVGNAILQFVIAPFKGIASAIKVFQDEGVKGIGNAARAFAAEMKGGVAFKENFTAGQAAADAMIAGGKSRKPAAEAAGKDLGAAAADAATKEMEARIQAYVEGVKKRTEFEKYLEDLRAKGAKEADDITAATLSQYDAETEAFLAMLAEQDEAARISAETQVAMAKEAAEKKAATQAAYADAASGIASSIADLLEAQGEEDEKSVKAAKNLRIAAATIDMIQGAVTAFSTAQQLGPIAGPIVGAVNAAAVVAAGLANIAKIRATNVSKDSSPTASSPDTPAVQSAPAIETAVPQTTVVNGARTEAALNNASQPQRVYILQSDIEAAGETSRVQVEESSF